MSSIFQSPEWEKFKLETGYSKSFRVDDILVLKKDLPLHRSMLYSPMIDLSQELRIKNKEYWNQIQEIAQEENSIFYRIEFDIPRNYKLETSNFGLIKSFEEMQPEHTLILDLSKTEEEILAQMKQKGRYNIKVAEKNGVKVEKTKSVEGFYQLYEKTANRQIISYRRKHYFETLLDILNQKDYCWVFNARHENQILASAIVSFYNDKAIYLFGGSSDKMRNVMAPYKLQWEAILEAKRRGCITYDFFGIAPDDNEKHPWAGVTRFKKQFGGEEVSIYGSYDKVYKPFEYRIFKIAEKLRRH